MDMAVGMKGEISQFLLKNPRLADTAGKILHRALEYGQFARSPDWFNDDMNFAAAVQQALSTKSSIIASCMALPLDRADVAFASLAHLATAPHESRKLLLAGWLHSEPAATTIDFRDMSLSADEAAAVAACLAKLPKLVAINVLRNDSMGFDGAQANAQWLISKPSACCVPTQPEASGCDWHTSAPSWPSMVRMR